MPDRAVRRIHGRRAFGENALPALPRKVGRVVGQERGVGQVAGERGAFVKYQRDAVVRMSRRGNDLAVNADALEKVAAGRFGEHDIALHGDFGVVVLGLGMAAHERDRRDLDVENEQLDAQLFQFLGESGVINMVVGNELVGYLFEANTLAAAAVTHHAQRAGPARVEEQARAVIGEDVIVGRAVAYVYDVHGGTLQRKTPRDWEFSDGEGGTRTHDLTIMSQLVLYKMRKYVLFKV